MSSAPIFETRKLSVSFGGLQALDSVDLHVHAGETLGLIGPNGAGKSTFFNLISGLYLPSGGEVRFLGEDLRGLKPYQIARRGIARTFQNNRLFWQLSVLDNVLIGMHARQKATLADVLLRYGRTRQELGHLAGEAIEILRSISKDLADDHRRLVADLAQGDRRRVEICRALAAGPKLLLLDEPSAGMSPDETEQLMEDIDSVRRQFGDLSVIIIEHDMAVIEKIARRVVVLNHGRKLAEGTFAAISSDPAVVEAYLGEEDDA